MAAAVAMGFWKILSHSEKTRFEVMPNARRSYANLVLSPGTVSGSTFSRPRTSGWLMKPYAGGVESARM